MEKLRRVRGFSGREINEMMDVNGLNLGPKQSKIALGDKVGQGQSAEHKVLGNAYHEAQIRTDHTIAGLDILELYYPLS